MKNISLKATEELRRRDQDLKLKIDRLGTEAGVEEEIRSKFNVVKSDENMVVVVEDQSQTEATSSSQATFWQKIWDFLVR